MPRPTVAHVDLAALQANYRALVELAASETAPAVLAVVKANAYGHGAVRVARALEDAGAPMLAVADIEEGVLLRESGVRCPILVFGALSVSDLGGLFRHALTPTISTPGAARALQAAAQARETVLHCHLKIDTGMNRLGFRHDNLRRTLREVLASPNLAFDTVFTHLATADDPESGMMDLQRQRFENACDAVEEMASRTRARTARRAAKGGLRRHAANSAAFLRDSRTWYDMVRPGLLLYGVVPPPLWSTLDLKPALSLTSRVVAVKGLRPEEGVGYGLRDAQGSPRTIAIVPAGYADGLDTRLSGRSAVLVRGRRAPIIGSVCMDMLTIDVTEIDQVTPGDEVVIIGEQGPERIDVREMAAAIGTIPYEILCRIGARIERVYDTSANMKQQT